MRWLPKLGTAGAKALGLAALLLSGAMGLKAQVAYIKEYPIPTPFGQPASQAGSITAGPDGALWFVDQSNMNTVWRLTTAGSFAYYALGFGIPAAITAGPDGAMWVAEGSSMLYEIFRVTTNGGVFGYQMPHYPHQAALRSISTGPDGALWFTGSRLTFPSGDSVELLGRITTGGLITDYPVSGDKIIAGPDGALWFTTPRGSVGRFTTQGVVTYFETPSPVYGITTGPDGALWFTEPASNKIGRMTIAGAVTEYPIPTPGSIPGEITQGPDGALWFTEQFQVGRITTAGDVTEYGNQFRYSNSIPGGLLPISITAGPDGNIWFTDRRGVIGKVVLYQGRPITRVSPLPQSEMTANFPVQWTGIGADSYTLYVSQDNGGPVPWLTTTATRTIFPGDLNHIYFFYTIGTDLSGNQESANGKMSPPEAWTRVAAAPGDLTGDGAVNCVDLAVVMASFGKRTGQPGFNPVADVNQDGVVNVRDLSWVSQYLPPGAKCQ